MGIRVEFERCDGYLLARVQGKWTVSEIDKALRTIASVAAKQAFNRVLLDLQELSAPPHDLARYLAGKTAAAVFGCRMRVAAVRPPALLDDFALTVALNRGAKATIAATSDEAIEWLLRGSYSCQPSV